jgi:general secretion pathway protein D
MNRTVRSMVLSCGAAAALVLPAAWAQDRPTQPALEANGRRVLEGPPTKLAFKNASVEEIVPFIVEVTGKIVMPQQTVMNKRITVLNDQPIPRELALDMVILSLQQNGVAVVETDRVVTLRDIAEVTRQDVPVIGPDESVLQRNDPGAIAEKIYRLRSNTAKKMGDVVKGTLPDFAKIAIDEESNQISVLGNVALLQRVEKLIDALDQPAAGAITTETFRLRYADASAIKVNIEELFGASSSQSRQREGENFRFRFPGGGGGSEQGAASTTEIRVTANTQQNSVTVVADPVVLGQIRSQIETIWDMPIAAEAVTPKIYDLKHSDPVKVAALLEGLFGKGDGGATGGQTRNNQGNNNQNNSQAPASGQGVGRLAGQFSFEAIPEASRLVVIAKSPDNIPVIDRIIEGLDLPQTAGLPQVVELKHASAEDLAEQINALLAQEGTLAEVRRAASGLSDASQSGASPFAADQQTSAQSGGDNEADTLSFWWQRARTPTDRRNSSNLIGLIRVVPVWRQNALLVVAPPEYQSSIAALVSELDKPGRQVLISAIVAEVSRDDALELGLRWGTQNVAPNRPDNSVSVGVQGTATENNFASSLFDTSVLNLNTNINAILSALAQKTDVSILSEPKIFTSDNQEAEFFDGQDIPFITDSQSNQQGGLTQSFDYRAVGIQLRARPRITVQGDVDLRVNLELSSIVPGQTQLGGFVVDRRETTTQLIVRDRQTIVISGILRDELSDVTRKVPLLGDIPILGWAFTSKDKVKTNTELLVFITPIVVNNTEDLGPANEPYVDRLDALQAKSPRATRGLMTRPMVKDGVLESTLFDRGPGAAEQRP